MSIDLERLTPTPWHVERIAGAWRVIAANGCLVGTMLSEEVANKVALQANAEDVMMRRGWYAVRLSTGRWNVCSNGMAQKLHSSLWDSWKALIFDDPFTALVESDRWYTEHVEGKPAGSSTNG